MESRTSPGPATLGHHDAVRGCLRRGGLSWSLTAHAYAILDSYLYGFALQEANLAFQGDEPIEDLAASIVAPLPADEYPDLVAFTNEHVLRPGHDFGSSFEIGLDLLLDGIAADAAAESANGDEAAGVPRPGRRGQVPCEWRPVRRRSCEAASVAAPPTSSISAPSPRSPPTFPPV